MGVKYQPHDTRRTPTLALPLEGGGNVSGAIFVAAYNSLRASEISQGAKRHVQRLGINGTTLSHSSPNKLLPARAGEGWDGGMLAVHLEDSPPP